MIKYQLIFCPGEELFNCLDKLRATQNVSMMDNVYPSGQPVNNILPLLYSSLLPEARFVLIDSSVNVSFS